MTKANDVALEIRREFKAPRELVFRTMLEAQHLKHWWGPKECTITVSRHEPRPGGVFHYCMHPREAAVPGAEMWGRFDYHEIEKPGRIVFVNGFADAEGNRIRLPMLPVWPLEILNTITLEEHGGVTQMTLRAVPVNASEAECAAFLAMHESMQGGYGGMFDLYEGYLREADTSDREIVLQRTLSAPRELVFEAFTDPKHTDKWWGPNGWTSSTLSKDVRAGGLWRFDFHGPNKLHFLERIEYLEVERPERLVYRHGAENDDMPFFHVTVTFEDAGDGRTLLTMRSVFKDGKALEEVKKFGAIEGGKQTLDRLEAFLASR
jgi:uncharacterized protein YndB with AHSA1/START domain